MFAFGSWQGTAGSQRLELSVANVRTTGYHYKELPVPRGWNSWFPTWEPEVTIASRFPKVGTLCCQRGNHRLPLQGTTGSQRMELLVPVQFPTWEPEFTMASNCPFLEVGTHASQPGNHRVPLQGTSGSQRLELSVANVGTTGYHCKELAFPRGWNSWFPTWEPEVTIASNCRFPKVGTLCCQRGNHRLPLQGTAGSQRMELLVPNLGTRGYHCKQLPVPRGWNSRFPAWEPQVTIARNFRFPEVGTLGSQPGNHRLPLQGTAGSQRLELLVPNLGTMGYHCKQLLKWYENIFVTTLWFCLMDWYRTLGFA